MRAQRSEDQEKSQDSSSDFSGARAPVHKLSGRTEGCPEIVPLVAHPGQAVSLCSVFFVESGLLVRLRDGGQDSVHTPGFVGEVLRGISLPTSFRWSPSKHFESPNS